MSTQINVYVGGENLLPRSQGVQQDNRWRQGEREQQRLINTSVEQAQADLRRVQQLNGTTRNLFRRQEIAANRRDAEETVIQVITALASGGYYYVLSIDRSQYEEIQFDVHPPSFPFGNAWASDGRRYGLLTINFPMQPLVSWEYTDRWMFLPVGREAAIALFSASKAWTAYAFAPGQVISLGQGSDMLTRAYIVGRSSVRQIGIPQTVQNYINNHSKPTFSNEPLEFSIGTLAYFTGTIPWNRAVVDPIGGLRAPDAYQYLVYDEDFFYRYYDYGPGTIAYLANPIAAAAAIEAQPTYQAEEQAARAYVRANYPPFPPGFARMRERFVAPGYYPGVGTSMGVSELVGRPTSDRADFIHDWARPAYCRQQLLALGFSESDLTP